MNTRTLRDAQYHIRTELGLSTTSYTHHQDMPIYGTGQGSGNSPLIWCFISSLLFDCYDALAHHASYCNPDRTHQINLNMIGFVDNDSNGQVNSFECDESKIELQRLVQKARYNVDADHMAGEFQDIHGRAHPLVLMSPLTKAHLRLSEGTVTGKYDRVLQHEATAKPLLLYIQQKNGWTPSVMKYIHWDAHGSALRQRPERRMHMTKLLHELLPTTGQANKTVDSHDQI
jgi:hypothetical protein